MTPPTSYIERVAAAIFAELHPGQAGLKPVGELYLGYAVLALVAGEDVTLENVHDAWAAWATRHCPDHPALRPFAELPPAERARDEPFRQAIRAVAAGR